MKNLFLGAILFCVTQVSLAQGSPDAIKFVNNLGVKTQIDAAKEQILPSIEVGKEAEFTKLVDENYDMELVKAANKKFDETKEMTQVLPKDAVAFQEKVNTLQNEIGMTLQGLVMKYASAEALQQGEE